MGMYFYVIIIIALFITAYKFYKILGNETESDKERLANQKRMFQEIEEVQKEVQQNAESGEESENNVEELLDEYAYELPDDKKQILKDLPTKLPGFSLKWLIDKLPEVYGYILENFTQGRVDDIKEILTNQMYDKLSNAVAARKENGISLKSEVIHHDKIEIIDVEIDESRVRIMILFETTQNIEQYDAEGNLISGNKDKYSEITEHWAMEKSLTSTDNRWILSNITSV